MKKYRALKPITRKSDNQDFPAGAEVELELTPEGEQLLIERGVIEKIAPKRAKSKQEADDGKV